MHSQEELISQVVKFKRVSDGKELSLTLYSHYTCVMGDSGIGKSSFIETVAENEVTGEIVIESSYPVAVATVGNLGGVLDIAERRIVRGSIERSFWSWNVNG